METRELSGEYTLSDPLKHILTVGGTKPTPEVPDHELLRRLTKTLSTVRGAAELGSQGDEVGDLLGELHRVSVWEVSAPALQPDAAEHILRRSAAFALRDA